MQRRVDKYCSPEIQNEMLKLMSLELLRGIAHNLHSAEMFSIMADECTDEHGAAGHLLSVGGPKARSTRGVCGTVHYCKYIR